LKPGAGKALSNYSLGGAPTKTVTSGSNHRRSTAAPYPSQPSIAALILTAGMANLGLSVAWINGPQVKIPVQ